MSIRKPHYKGITMPIGSGYSTAPNRNTSTSPVWTVPYRSDEWRNVSATGSTWEIKKPEFIPTPDWVEKIEGYSEEAFELYDGCPRYANERAVAVCYKPEKTLGVGFTKVFFTDKDLKNVFPQMKGVWAETQKRIDSENTTYGARISTCKIDGNGRISSAFGIPDLPSLLDVVQEMYTVWLDWHEFPNASEFSMVNKLKQAKRDVAVMQREMEGNGINKEIEEYRAEIKESQEKIAKLEKELNDICERAADAMNLLEENGVKIDLDKNDEETAYATLDGYGYQDLISHAYPGQGIMIEPPPSGTLLSTLPPETFQLSKEEMDIFNQELGNISAVQAYNSAGANLSCAS